MTSFTLHVHSSVSEIPKETWDACVGDDSPFVEHTWLSCFEDAGCVGGEDDDHDHAVAWQPAHLALYDGKELVGLAPSYVKTNSEGEFIFDWSWADLARRIGLRYYPKLLVASPFSPVTGARVLVSPAWRARREEAIVAMASAARQVADESKLSSAHALFLRDDEAALWERAGYSRRASVQYHWFNEGYETFDDWVATFKSKKRNQLRREAAQPGKDGVRIATLAPDEITPAIVAAMYRFYLVTVDKFMWGRRYLNRRFFELVADRFRHRLAWVVAFRGDEPIAGAFNLEKGDRLYGRYWGATAELPFLHFNVCYYHGIRHCIERDLKVFEPGAGGEHKLARGFRPTMMHSAHYVQNARFRQIIDDFLLREREAVERFIASPDDEEP